jgi:hypothetical protein
MGFNPSNVPKTLQRGLIPVSTGNGDEVAWVPMSVLQAGVEIGIPYIIPEPVEDFEGVTPFYLPVIPGNIVTLVGIVAYIKYGILTVSIEQNTADIAGLTGIVIGYYANPNIFLITPVPVNNFDLFGINVTHFTEYPRQLSITFLLSIISTSA